VYSPIYLISIQASQELRRKRLMGKGLYKNEAEFYEADKRDAAEPKKYGQQVKLCNYLSDIIISNEEDFAKEAVNRKRELGYTLDSPPYYI
jgi:dephospho-CoA kinase